MSNKLIFDKINWEAFKRIYKLYAWIKQPTNKQTEIYSVVQRQIDFIGQINKIYTHVVFAYLFQLLSSFCSSKLLYYKSDSIWTTISWWLTASGCLDTFRARTLFDSLQTNMKNEILQLPFQSASCTSIILHSCMVYLFSLSSLHLNINVLKSLAHAKLYSTCQNNIWWCVFISMVSISRGKKIHFSNMSTPKYATWKCGQKATLSVSKTFVRTCSRKVTEHKVHGMHCVFAPIGIIINAINFDMLHYSGDIREMCEIGANRFTWAFWVSFRVFTNFIQFSIFHCRYVGCAKQWK